MEQAPIERTVVWIESAQDWYDKETDVRIGNLTPNDIIAPLQENHHPFDKSFYVTYEQVQKLIDEAFERRTIPNHPVYWFEADWLVTYGWHADLARQMGNKTTELEQRIARLERPWWRRWLSR